MQHTSVKKKVLKDLHQVAGRLQALLRGRPALTDAEQSGRQGGFTERKFPRFGLEVTCLYAIESGHEWHGTLVNLSRGGCTVRTTAPVQPGGAARILIFLSRNQSPIEISLAFLRWATNVEFVADFIKVAPADTKRLQDYLADLETAM